MTDFLILIGFRAEQITGELILKVYIFRYAISIIFGIGIGLLFKFILKKIREREDENES